VDKATLVKSDLKVLGQVLLALSRAKIPITVCDWHYVSPLDEWQLIVATPLYDTKGPHEAYSKIVGALQHENIYQDVPIRRMFVKSPSDPQVKLLEREMSTGIEGTIFLDFHNGPNRKNIYSVVFAPFIGPGGAVPAKRFSDRQVLLDFLESDLHLSRSRAEEALTELHHRNHTWISSILLTKRNAKKLGLA